MVTIWINDRVVKNPGRRLHGETSCKLFGALHEAVCQTKWKAAGCRSTCLVKISVYFGLLTHHPHFTELSLKPLGKVRVPICVCSMLSCSLSIPAEALPRAEAVFPSRGEIVLLVAIYAQTSCLWKNMLSTLAEIFIPLFAFSTFSLQLCSLLHFSLDFLFISIFYIFFLTFHLYQLEVDQGF